ncbi:MAG: hypothetical protein J2O44_04425 [Porphyrobacter sp.]|nr:hypothetical protein [Porphyrobacter sp.]
MSTLEWILVGLILLGIAPAWLIGIAAFVSARTRKPTFEKPSARYFAYARLLEAFHVEIGGSNRDFEIENGPLFVARLRELKNYPEFKDITLLYLEELSVTGSRKFDNVMRNELKAVETHLLDVRDG